MSEIETTLIIDLATGEEIIRALNDDEIALNKKMKSEQKKIQDTAKAKAEARQSALAKLAALGLTEEEIGAL
jgi:DNA-binding NarL/FixJ family response regulator